ncbi:cupin domain-containing protein [Streptomyces sp. NPDC001054]
MTVAESLPDKNDPVWTAANGFVIRADEGDVRRLGHERFAVKATGDHTGDAFAFRDGSVEPGDFEFINGDQKFHAGPGDFIYIPKGARHGFRNAGSEPARLLVFYTPAGPESFFLKSSQEEGAAIPLTRQFYETVEDQMAAHNIVVLPSDGDWA